MTLNDSNILKEIHYINGIIMIALSAIQLIFGNFLYIYITSDYLKKENIFKFKVFHKV